jgi:hypothetical protein
MPDNPGVQETGPLTDPFIDPSNAFGDIPRAIHTGHLRSHLSSGQDALGRPILQVPKVRESFKKWDHILTNWSTEHGRSALPRTKTIRK